MSKILLFTDVHWSATTSIVRGKGQTYSTRLEFLVKSLNWVNELAVEKNCDAMICLGDFFDKSQITADEITPLRDIKWNKLPTTYLVGNHESNVASLDFSTVDMFRNKRVKIVSKPEVMFDDYYDLLFLPYITEDNRKSIKEYYDELKTVTNRKIIVFSHNDLKNVQYGGFVSKTGFDIEDIEANCDLFLNGHIHNGGFVTSKVVNLGSLTAQNFTNDSFEYEYGCWILDTNTLDLTFYENPYSLNFYKIDINTKEDIKKLYKLKSNAVLSIRCLDELVELTKEVLDSIKDIITYRLILYTNNKASVEQAIISDSVNHLNKFAEFMRNRDDIEDKATLEEELAHICK